MQNIVFLDVMIHCYTIYAQNFVYTLDKVDEISYTVFIKLVSVYQ